MQLLTNSLLMGLGAAIGNQVSQRITCSRSPYPMPHQFAKMLDHPWRLRYREPVETVGNLGITAGMTLLDLGCGTGTFTMEMAQMVGSEGIVHAVDLQRPFLENAQKRITEAGLETQVRWHHSGAYQLPIDTSVIDLAIVIATLSEIPDKIAVLAELRRVLKPGARLAVSEELPDPTYVPPQVTRRQVETAGFTFGGQHGSFFCYSQIFLNKKDEMTIEGVATDISAVA